MDTYYTNCCESCEAWRLWEHKGNYNDGGIVTSRTDFQILIFVGNWIRDFWKTFNHTETMRIMYGFFPSEKRTTKILVRWQTDSFSTNSIKCRDDEIKSYFYFIFFCFLIALVITSCRASYSSSSGNDFLHSGFFTGIRFRIVLLSTILFFETIEIICEKLLSRYSYAFTTFPSKLSFWNEHE